MWWDIIPSGTIVMVLVAVPQITGYYWNQAFFGNYYKRKLETTYQRHMFSRDGRLTGAAWILNDLETIPDE